MDFIVVSTIAANTTCSSIKLP